VQDNQTVVLGGIISNEETRRVQKIPILGDIPLLGNLFRNTVKNKGRTELVVFITPRVVREPGAADEIRSYERSRLQVDPLKILETPFHKPLELTPDALRRRRSTPTESENDSIQRGDTKLPEEKPLKEDRKRDNGSGR
jgi:type II secretory pathway component GspD/PulD (secretin)